jgi:glycosyltransferase involved in cell wall biosynthesis
MMHPQTRILFILSITLPYPSAAWTRIEFLANYLKKYNYDVRIAGAFSVKTILNAGYIEVNRIKIYNVIPVIILPNLIALCFNILSSLVVGFILCLIIRPKLMIISLPSSGLVDAMGFFIISRIFRTKVITDYRDEWEDYFHHISKGEANKKFLSMTKSVMTRYYRNSSAVSTVTEAVANSLMKRGIEQVEIIPNGADAEVFKPQKKLICRNNIGIQSDCFALIYTGYIGSYYRLDILIYALKQVITKYNAKTILLIAGQGSGLKSLLKLADHEGIRKNVIYLGKIINKSELVNALCASDIGIIPHDSKPLSRNALPVKSLEYLACGLPLVAAAYEDSLLGRLIVENKLGLVAEPDNVDSMFEAIKRMDKDATFRIEVSVRGPLFIRQKYDRNKIATAFHSLILRILNE